MFPNYFGGGLNSKLHHAISINFQNINASHRCILCTNFRKFSVIGVYPLSSDRHRQNCFKLCCVQLWQLCTMVCTQIWAVLPSVRWRCWLGCRKGIQPVKNEWWGAGMVICLERGADLHVAQRVPLPLTVSCSSKIQIGFTFLVPADPGSPRQRLLNRCVCACMCVFYWLGSFMLDHVLILGEIQSRGSRVTEV